MAARPGGSRAVETFLRNFEGEKHRYQEILEVALCYGVFCLAQNFSLKGITVQELHGITRYNEIRRKDFYVRKAGGRWQPSVPVEMEALPQHLLRTKPSHAWRDGASKTVISEFSSHLPAAGDSGSGEDTSVAGVPTVASYLGLAGNEVKDVDDIDFLSRVLGKRFVDTAWAAFTGRKGSQIDARDALEELFVRVDQRKNALAFPTVELPVSAFSDFLRGYVVSCVSHYQHVNSRSVDDSEDVGNDEDVQGKSRIVESTSAEPSRRIAPSSPSGVEDWHRERATKMPSKVAQRQRRTQDKAEVRQVPKSLQHVRSKLQPELSARREKALRVKKTQSQLMKENLARARLAEYEAKKHLEDVRGRTSSRKVPLSDITQGAAALEIVDNFVRGPLMDTFGKDGSPLPANISQSVGKRDDPVREELYGATALGDSFVGCKLPGRQSSGTSRKEERDKRGYNGWLGDFGPGHTKTVRREWSDSDGSDDGEQRAAPKFEWSFEHFEDKDTNRTPRHARSKSLSRKDTRGHGRSADRNWDEFKDDHSEASDSVYQWLEETV